MVRGNPTSTTRLPEGLLGELGTAALDRLLRAGEPIDVPPGTTVIRQGAEGDTAYLVLEGTLDVVLETAVGEVEIATIGARQIVGEIAVFTDLRRTATVRARTAARLLALRRSTLTAMIAEHPELGFAAIAALGRRVNRMTMPLALLTLAARALEREDLDLEAFGRMLGSVGDDGPFAVSFQHIVTELREKSARRHEMEFAARLQRSILPETLDIDPVHPFRAGAFMRPAREIGGDFYDFIPTADGRVFLVVADVSGKGVPAALFMAVTRTTLRANLQAAASLEEAITTCNAALEADNREGLFVTVFAAELDLASGCLRYVSAGHCDTYLLRRGAGTRILAPTGPALAMVPGRRFDAIEVVLADGDVLVVVSDGVTEAHAADGAIFGEARLVQLLEDLTDRSVDSVLSVIDGAVTGFAAGREPSDDLTCLVLARA